MARPKDLIQSSRVRIDGNRKRGLADEREAKTWAWLDAIPAGERFDKVWDLITAAVNGELGVAPTVSLGDVEDDQAQAKLQDLLANMVMDEDE